MNSIQKSLAAAFGGTLLAILMVILVFAGPFLFIFGLNLLGMAVPYTLETWCGAFILLFLGRSGGSK